MRYSQSDDELNTDAVSVSVRKLGQLQYQVRALHGLTGMPHKGLSNLLAGQHRSHHRGRGLVFDELRAYQTGDDGRYMDWKVTNRIGKPHIRVFKEERERPVMMLVDQRQSMFFGSTGVMKSVAAAEVAAIIGWSSLFNGDQLGALLFTNDDIRELPSRQSESSLFEIFSAT